MCPRPLKSKENIKIPRSSSNNSFNLEKYLQTKFSPNRLVKGMTFFIPFDSSHWDLSFDTSFVTLACVNKNLNFTIFIKIAFISPYSSKTIRIFLFLYYLYSARQDVSEKFSYVWKPNIFLNKIPKNSWKLNKHSIKVAHLWGLFSRELHRIWLHQAY